MPLVGVPVTPGVGRTILTRTLVVADEPVDIQLVQINLSGEAGTDMVLGVGQQPMSLSIPVTMATDQPAVPAVISGTVDVSGSTVNVSGTVAVAGTVAVSSVGGTVTVAGEVSVSVLPLPPNAAQETGGNLAAILATLNDGIGLPGSSGTWVEKAASTSAQVLWAANANRKGGTIWNNSTGVLYVLLGSGITTAKFTAGLTPLSNGIGGFFEVPFGYTGPVELIWATGSMGSAYCEEFV